MNKKSSLHQAPTSFAGSFLRPSKGDRPLEYGLYQLMRQKV